MKAVNRESGAGVTITSHDVVMLDDVGNRNHYISFRDSNGDDFVMCRERFHRMFYIGLSELEMAEKILLLPLNVDITCSLSKLGWQKCLDAELPMKAVQRAELVIVYEMNSFHTKNLVYFVVKNRAGSSGVWVSVDEANKLITEARNRIRDYQPKVCCPCGSVNPADSPCSCWG